MFKSKMSPNRFANLYNGNAALLEWLSIAHLEGLRPQRFMRRQYLIWTTPIRGWLVLSAVCALIACESGPGPRMTDEMIAKRNARAEALRPAMEALGRQNWDRALATGETVFTLSGNGSREVVTDVELRANDYCARTLARRGPNTWDDFWVNFDLPGSPPRTKLCTAYTDVNIRQGDARKK